MKAKLMGMLLLMLAGWINRHQQDVIVYLKEENKVLREKLGIRGPRNPCVAGSPFRRCG